MQGRAAFFFSLCLRFPLLPPLLARPPRQGLAWPHPPAPPLCELFRADAGTPPWSPPASSPQAPAAAFCARTVPLRAAGSSSGTATTHPARAGVVYYAACTRRPLPARALARSETPRVLSRRSLHTLLCSPPLVHISRSGSLAAVVTYDSRVRQSHTTVTYDVLAVLTQ